MSRWTYWFARNASWAIENDMYNKKRRSRSKSTVSTNRPISTPQETTPVNPVTDVYYYKPERKRILICSLFAIIFSSLGVFLFYQEIVWPIACILLCGIPTWICSLLIMSHSANFHKSKIKIPEGEEKYQGRLRWLRFFGCLFSLLISGYYIIPATDKGSVFSSIFGVILIIAIGYPFVYSIGALDNTQYSKPSVK